MRAAPAESASRAAIDGLGVFAERRPEHLDEDASSAAQWAYGRSGASLAAYARTARRRVRVRAMAPACCSRGSLAENNLLLHPKYRAPVTLEDCEELAAELGEPDGVVGRRPVRSRDPAGHLPTRRPLRAPAARARRPACPRADPRRPAGRDLRSRRRAGVGVPVLAEGQEGRGQRL